MHMLVTKRARIFRLLMSQPGPVLDDVLLSLHNRCVDGMSEVGGENGAERSPPPGIQAQRPSPSRRVTTRQINGEREVSKMSARVNWIVRGFSPRHIRGCGPESTE